MDLHGVRVLVTGGRGFLGHHVCAAVRARGGEAVAVGSAEADLTDRDEALQLVRDISPAVVMHCAAQGGGIGWMKSNPVESGRDNALINTHILDASWRGGARAFVGASSACAYPRICPVPFREETMWDGPPEPTNGPYAESKRLMMSLGRAYQHQHGFPARFAVLANLYGPGDHISPERAHVVAALLQRVVADPDELVVWGSGTPTREFLYVEDAADGMLAMLDWERPEPLNIGTGVEVSIADLARAVARVAGYAGPIILDRTKPDGQPRKCLDVTRASRELGWTAKTDLETGLAKTVAWYRRAMHP
ncbi:MAG: NAD-dependent epimerase/dehydratase family protein [Myxococcota bacterium]|nr:NAD-dependent epimerase/dehydratase family protein [Myxococcota bacterium]MEC8424269.1 NAD-dependent epimerase/dehydratase family protein [Myxococcota bacterium]